MTDASPAEYQRPVDHLTVKVAGEPVKLKMTFGLLNEICRHYGDVHAATQAPLNAELRDATMVLLFSPRDENGEIPDGKMVRLATLDISLDEAEDAVSWASEHAIYFFVTALKRVVKAQRENAALKDLMKVAGVTLQAPGTSTTSSVGTES
ncbi:hypothetical protein PJWF_00019 [Achromobacter phage JWF]|uniref:tail length tape measure protein chaperone n=1 Tax=Achromobacter phage JWF TaxID=1589748 RepID=UPI000588E197|nr:tail length tape measure protein chaperone [Achromobacter phage JWF]AJD82913.1 hypothetical protein PJWF_00019 [Achromobacter phage JWF]